MRTLDADMAALVATGGRAPVDRPAHRGDDRPRSSPARVHTDRRAPRRPTWSCWAWASSPRATLAEAAGLELGVRGAIRVDRRQQTARRGRLRRRATAPSPSTWSAGARCTWRSAPWPTARAAWPASTSVGATPPSRVWSAPPSPASAAPRWPAPGSPSSRPNGPASTFNATTVESTTQAGYLADAEPITVKLVAEAGTGRVLGGQIVGGRGAACASTRWPRRSPPG